MAGIPDKKEKMSDDEEGGEEVERESLKTGNDSERGRRAHSFRPAQGVLSR